MPSPHTYISAAAAIDPYKEASNRQVVIGFMPQASARAHYSRLSPEAQGIVDKWLCRDGPNLADANDFRTVQKPGRLQITDVPIGQVLVLVRMVVTMVRYTALIDI